VSNYCLKKGGPSTVAEKGLNSLAKKRQVGFGNTERPRLGKEDTPRVQTKRANMGGRAMHTGKRRHGLGLFKGEGKKGGSTAARTRRPVHSSGRWGFRGKFQNRIRAVYTSCPQVWADGYRPGGNAA